MHCSGLGGIVITSIFLMDMVRVVAVSGYGCEIIVSDFCFFFNFCFNATRLI